MDGVLRIQTERNLPARREEPPRACAHGCQEAIGLIVNGEFETKPVVHRTPLELVIAEHESQRADQMKLGAGGDA